MIVNTVLLEKGLRTEFNKALAEAKPPELMMLATTVPSMAASEKYGWLGDMPDMREWVGEKQIKSALDHEYTIINKNWESTIAVDRNELDDDQIGAIKPRVQSLSMRAKNYPARLIHDLILNGVTGLAYDGSAFFANRTAPNDNLLAGTGITEAQVLADLAAARAAMLRFTDDNGIALGIYPDTIVCPPEMEIVFQKIVASTTYITATASGVANVWAGSIKTVIVDPWLTDVDDWYAFAVNMPLKPFVFQERQAPQFVALDKATDLPNFLRRKLLYSAESRSNAGYGFFQQGVKTVN